MSNALQMLYHRADDGQLYVRRIGNRYALVAVGIDQTDRIIIIHRERKHALVADHLDDIFLRTLMTDKAPRGRAGETISETEYRTDRIFRIIQMGTVGSIAMRLGDHTEELLKQVKLMRGKIIEIAASRDVRLESPWQIL